MDRLMRQNGEPPHPRELTAMPFVWLRKMRSNIWTSTSGPTPIWNPLSWAHPRSSRQECMLGRGLNWEHSAKVFSKCSMKC